MARSTVLLVPLVVGCAATNKPYILTTADARPLPNTSERLAEELAGMVADDQEVRNEAHDIWNTGAEVPQEISDRMHKVDAKNTERMKHIVMDMGWPTANEIGRQAVHDAWLLVQHADQQPEFQRYCLGLMEPLVGDGGVHPQEFAYLTDRVLVADKKPQIYGTQFHKVNGKMQPRPIRDEKNVDKRRAAIGLSTMEEYAKIIKT
jgi:hypothetical protein